MCLGYLLLGAVSVGVGQMLSVHYSWLAMTTAGRVSGGLALVGLATVILRLAVTCLLRVKTQASEAENRYRGLFDRSLDCVFLLRLDGVVLDLNQAALDLLGYGAEDIGVLNYHDVVVAEQLDEVAADFEEVVQVGWQETSKAYTLRAKDGRRVDVESRAFLVYADGVPYAVHGIARDITARREHEHRLRESELRFRQIAGAISEVFWLASTHDASFLYVSPASTKVLGWAPADLMADSRLWLDAVHSEDRPFVTRAVEELGGMGARFDVDFRITHADGTLRWINGRAYAICDDAGLFTLTAGVWTDITQRKHDETQLRLVSTVFERTREGILVADAENRIVWVNRAFTEITGFTETEVTGATPALLRSGRQDAAFYGTLWRALREHGHWEGEIWNRRKTGEVYPEWLTITEIRNEAGTLTHRLGIFADISDRKASEQRMLHLAQCDLLTDLPNRSLLSDRLRVALAQTASRGRCAALLMIDLDRFKLVNESLGHEIGDRLLQAVAERLRSVVRAPATLGRHGGDEFVVVLTDIDDAQSAGRVGSAILESVSGPYRLDEREVRISASIGIAVYPDDGADDVTMFSNADAAVSAAKEAGGGRCQFFSMHMNQRASERLTLEHDLRVALERGELFLAYQPQVSLTTGRIVGVEALARWQHPTLGLVPPSRFVPVAEESGLIVAIGDWALRTACRQAAVWRKRGVLDTPVGVNVSAMQFRQPNFLAGTEDVFQQEDAPPSSLELEVTESVVMNGIDAVARQLGHLKAIGVSLAIDDFGTGYSSLGYLRQLPVHRLKVDRAFVKDLPDDPDAQAVVNAIVQMSQALGLSVVAEGVETEGQADYLRAIGCHDAQGFLYSKPLPAEKLEDWLLERLVRL